MPRQEYDCPEHGKFEVVLPIGDDVPPIQFCRVDENEGTGKSSWRCLRRSAWVPPTVSFPGGPTTGARPPYIQGDDDA